MHPYTQTTVAVYRPQASTAHIVIAWIVTVLTGFYMLPWAIAATRSKQNIGPIVLINVFLGWTFIGWVAALVMAWVSDPQPTFVAAVTTGPYGYPPAGSDPYPPQYQQYPPQQYPPQGYPQPGYPQQQYPPQGYPPAQQYPPQPQQQPAQPLYQQLGYEQPRSVPEPFQQQQPQYRQPATRPLPTVPVHRHRRCTGIRTTTRRGSRRNSRRRVVRYLAARRRCGVNAEERCRLCGRGA